MSEYTPSDTALELPDPNSTLSSGDLTNIMSGPAVAHNSPESAPVAPGVPTARLEEAPAPHTTSNPAIWQAKLWNPVEGNRPLRNSAARLIGPYVTDLMFDKTILGVPYELKRVRDFRNRQPDPGAGTMPTKTETAAKRAAAADAYSDKLGVRFAALDAQEAAALAAREAERTLRATQQAAARETYPDQERPMGRRRRTDENERIARERADDLTSV
jgi:hypothetical protein